MKKIILVLVSVLIIISFSCSAISADIQVLSRCTVTRGATSQYLSDYSVYKSSSSSSSYCVNLVSSSPEGVSPSYVGSNHLIFRPYHDGVAAAYSVDFYGTKCSSGGNRLYGSYYTNMGQQSWYYRIKNSLSSDSISATADFSLRWNP